MWRGKFNKLFVGIHYSFGRYTVRGLYKFDDQFATYLTVGHIDNSTNAAYGVSGEARAVLRANRGAARSSP